jgi:hypothetical protein
MLFPFPIYIQKAVLIKNNPSLRPRGKFFLPPPPLIKRSLGRISQPWSIQQRRGAMFMQLTQCHASGNRAIWPSSRFFSILWVVCGGAHDGISK